MATPQSERTKWELNGCQEGPSRKCAAQQRVNKKTGGALAKYHKASNKAKKAGSGPTAAGGKAIKALKELSKKY